VPLLSPSDQDKLRAEFDKMTRPVRLLFFTQTIGCETCPQTKQILDELPALSDRIAIDEVNLVLDKDRAAQFGVDRAPAIAIVSRDENGTDHDSRIRFWGTPAGYEFISLVHAVLLVGGGRESTLTDESRAALAAVDRPLALQVFTTPT
jgi:alkyl hydroperoxide reductase subunit AhpF